jgi:SAM-dependent methyltransferase
VENKAVGRKEHWENIYTTKTPNSVSWYQERPEKSLQLIARSRILKSSRIIDVGGGASTLVDNLIGRNFLQVMVLDISNAALKSAQARLGERSRKVEWIEADILSAKLPAESIDLWHDRAVFHFFTRKEDQEKYTEQMKQAVKSGGHVIIATFALDGPAKCSGLDVERYDTNKLQDQIGSEFDLVESFAEDHQTPLNTMQKFVYHLFRKKQK